MIYFVGGSPRSGKSILGQQIAAKLRIGWISTDLLFEILRAKQVEGMKTKWDASTEAITLAAEWFFPCLERFVWRISSHAESYLIEGADFLPAQVARLSAKYQISSVFLGCSKMTLDRFDRFPGHTHGYAHLPKDVRQQFAQDIPFWSEFVRQEAERYTFPYIDMSDEFPTRLNEAEAMLIVSPRCN